MMLSPMLAKEFHPRHLTADSVLQPKFNGMRLVWTGSKLITRRGKPITGVPHIEKELKAEFDKFPIDGELFVDPSVVDFNKLVGKIRRSKIIDLDERVKFYAFDLPVKTKKFETRHNELIKAVAGNAVVLGVPCVPLPVHAIRLFEEWGVGTKQQKKEWSALKQALNIFANQHEGTMVRNPDGLYAFGKRSSDLLKIKDFKDAEFKVVGFVELESHEKVLVPPNTPGAIKRADGTWVKNGKATPMGALGAFKCAIHGDDSVVFEVGTGLDNDMRNEYWQNKEKLIGKFITVKYQVLHPSGKPQFPVFVEIRDYE